MTLAGKRIAITRPANLATSFAARLADVGAHPLTFPCIAIEAVTDMAELIAELRALHAADWVLFTSVHAVDAFARTTSSEWPRVRWQKQCAAVGRTTASALRAHGLDAAVVPSRASATALVDAVGSLNGRVVLYPASNLANDDVDRGVRAQGGVVRRVTAYRTVPGEGIDALASAVSAHTIDAAAFWSPSAVEFVAARLPFRDWPRRTRVVCAGESTAMRATHLGVTVHATATAPTTDEMLRALRVALR